VETQPSGRPGEAYYLITTVSWNSSSGMPGEAYYLTATIFGSSPSGRPGKAYYPAASQVSCAVACPWGFAFREA